MGTREDNREFIETLIIGGGKSGLAMSHMLSKRGHPHLVLEQHRIAERWRILDFAAH